MDNELSPTVTLSGISTIWGGPTGPLATSGVDGLSIRLWKFSWRISMLLRR